MDNAAIVKFVTENFQVVPGMISAKAQLDHLDEMIKLVRTDEQAKKYKIEDVVLATVLGLVELKYNQRCDYFGVIPDVNVVIDMYKKCTSLQPHNKWCGWDYVRSPEPVVVAGDIAVYYAGVPRSSGGGDWYTHTEVGYLCARKGEMMFYEHSSWGTNSPEAALKEAQEHWARQTAPVTGAVVRTYHHDGSSASKRYRPGGFEGVELFDQDGQKVARITPNTSGGGAHPWYWSYGVRGNSWDQFSRHSPQAAAQAVINWLREQPEGPVSDAGLKELNALLTEL